MEEYFNLIYCLVLKIPSNFWGVLFGSLFTLLGVYLTNKGNNQRLDKQLSSDRREKAIANEYGVRKEVYLDAVDALQAGIVTVSMFSNPDLSFAEILNPYKEKSSLASRVNLIASEKTLSELNAFGSLLSTAIYQLTIQRAELLAMNRGGEFEKAQAKLSLDCISEVIKLTEKIHEVIICFRVDLGVNTNVDEYRRIVEIGCNHQAEIKNKFSNYIN